MTRASKRRFRNCLIGFLLIQPTCLPAAPAADDARAWVDKMVQAVQMLNYDGIFIYQHGQQLETVRIIHQSDPSGTHERERLVSLTGAAREVIQDGDQTTCYLPDQKSVMVERNRPRKPYPLTLPDNAAQIARYYDFVLANSERMAGHDARIVTIKPHDAYRYGYRLWLDTDNGMPLKSDLLDEHGDAVEQVMFTSIQFMPQVPADLLQPTSNSAGFTWHRDSDDSQETRLDTAQWRVTRLPDGFMLTHHSRHPMPDSRNLAEHLVFSDGLASLSVYIEQADDDRKMLNGMSHMGAVNAYGAVVDGKHVTVVGEVPHDTVRMVGESIRYQPDPAPTQPHD